MYGAKNGKFSMPYDDKRALEFMKIYEDLVQKSWSDPDLRDRMKTDLTGILQEKGFNCEGFDFEAYEHEWEDRHVVRLPLPKKPDESKMSEEELSAIAGGGSCAATSGTAATASCPACTASSGGSAGTAC